MTNDRFSRMGVGTRKGVLAFAVVLAMSLVGCLGVAAPALAGEPTGIYSDFKECPTSAAPVCIYSQITGGETTLGKLRVPIVNPITFSFGYITEPTTPGVESEVVADLGETLSATPQPIPGGLSSLIDCHKIRGGGFFGWARRGLCRALLRNPSSGTAYATMELAEPPSAIYVDAENESSETGIALKYAVKFHLENPLLGRECYIGTDSEPVVFTLTTAATDPPPPNKPIHGSAGTFFFGETIIEVTGKIRVDNAFSVPAASGCGRLHGFRGPHGESLLDSAIDSTIGLPSPAGYNTTIQSGYSKVAGSPTIIASEK